MRFQWRWITGMLFMALLLVMGQVNGTTARAAPQAYHNPSIGTKIVLADKSIDAPSLWTSNFATPRAILAWTGTDTLHHINLMTSNDGLHFSDKHILPEYSLSRPAVVFNLSGRGSPYGTLYIAWTGTDSAHTLNLLSYSMPGFHLVKKITFWGETAFKSPAVAVMNDGLQVLWAGTDPAHTLNIIPFSRFGERLAKQIFWGWNTIASPHISFDSDQGTLLMAWTAHDMRINYVFMNEKGKWVMPASSPMAHFSLYGPDMMGINATNTPQHWVVWNGTGEFAYRHILVQFTVAYPDWTVANNMTGFSELSIAEIAIGYVGNAHQALIAWTGADSAHHLNVATVNA